MKAQAKVNIHNRFDIFLNDKQVGYAENIVLDQMYTRLCARSSYFVNIHFGTGTGTLSASRESLFTHLGTKTAVNDAQSKALPTSWWRQKIVLNPEEYVGSALSEVGIAFGSTSTNLVTHALIRDMNGNVITLTKTALDVVTIYATVYVTFSTSNANLVLVGATNGTNALVNFLIGDTAWPSSYFYTGSNKEAGGSKSCAVNQKTPLGTSAVLTWTTDIANKKTYTNTYRFAIDASNGALSEIGLGGSSIDNPFARLLLPASGVYAGLALSGVSVGTGDGSTRKFPLPSKDINIGTLVIKIDGTPTSAFTLEDISSSSNFVGKLSADAGGDCRGSAISSDGKVMAFGRASNSAANVAVYDKTDGVWVKRPALTGADSTQSYMPALDADGNVLFVGSSAGRVYDWANGVWTQRPVMSSFNANWSAISDDGSVIAGASQYESPTLCCRKWNNSAWETRETFPSAPSSCTAVALSADGLIIAVTNTSSPYIHVYDWVANAWVKRTAPGTLPAGSASGCALSSDGLVLAVAHANSPYVTTYDWSAGAWVKRANPANLPSGQPGNVGLNADGTMLLTRVSDTINLYDWVEGAWIKRSYNPTQGAGSFIGSALSRDGKQVAISTYNGFWDSNVVDVEKRNKQVYFNSPPANGAVITADYTVNGIHKTNQRVIDLYAEIVFGEVT